MKKKKKANVKKLVVFPSAKQEKNFSLQKMFYPVALSTAILQIFAFSVLPHIWYRPTAREFDDSNLFSDKEVIVPVEEQEDILHTLEKELGIKIDDNRENYLLLHAVLENPYLNAKEKEIFYKFIEYFNDNPYINREEFYENMLNVNARFSLRGALDKEENVLAIYLSNYRDIVYFELFPSVDTMAHEDGHCIHECKNMPNFIVEGIDQLIVSEYFSETPFLLTTIYPYQVSFVKLLCEMIGTDIVLQSYTEDKPELIYNALDNLIGKENHAKGIIEDLDACMENYRRYNASVEEAKKANQTLLDFLEYVNAFEFEDEEAVQYHLSVFVSLFTDHYGTLEEYLKFTVCKAYLSSSLKEAGFTKGITVTTEEYLGVVYQY